MCSISALMGLKHGANIAKEITYANFSQKKNGKIVSGVIFHGYFLFCYTILLYFIYMYHVSGAE